MMLLLRMSFYHILPSNTSPDTFPQNHASSYSTPVNHSNIMEGDWEVAILSVSHSNCVNTFNDDAMTVTDTSGDLSRIRSPLRVNIYPPSKTYTSTPTYIEDFMKQLNAILKNIITFKWSRRNPHKFTYEFHTSKYYLYLSD